MSRWGTGLRAAADRRNVTWVGFFRSERRVRERAVPVVRAVRADAGRCGAGGPGNHVDV